MEHFLLAMLGKDRKRQEVSCQVSSCPLLLYHPSTACELFQIKAHILYTGLLDNGSFDLREH